MSKLSLQNLLPLFRVLTRVSVATIFAVIFFEVSPVDAVTQIAAVQGSVQNDNAADSGSYWTPERLQNARPMGQVVEPPREFPTQFVIGLLLLVVVIGVVYNLWRTTRAYGGIIGQGLRLVGLGILFFVVEALDRVIVVFTARGVLAALLPVWYELITHDLLFVFGLLFVTLGFGRFLHGWQR